MSVAPASLIWRCVHRALASSLTSQRYFVICASSRIDWRDFPVAVGLKWKPSLPRRLTWINQTLFRDGSKMVRMDSFPFLPSVWMKRGRLEKVHCKRALRVSSPETRTTDGSATSDGIVVRRRGVFVEKHEVLARIVVAL